nr:hypothetical protein BaRGS_019865 [Batillaria attramentaria]
MTNGVQQKPDSSKTYVAGQAPGMVGFSEKPAAPQEGGQADELPPKVGEQIAKILEREELCVPCNEVLLGPSPDEEAMLNVFTKRDSKDGQKCCVSDPLSCCGSWNCFEASIIE